MAPCPKCAGTGLIGGNPDRPWERIGQISRCDQCGGTGQLKIEEVGSTIATEPGVDNAEPASKRKRGILRLFGIGI